MLNDFSRHTHVGKRRAKICAEDSEKSACRNRNHPCTKIDSVFFIRKYCNYEGENNSWCIDAVRPDKETHNIPLGENRYQQCNETNYDDSYSNPMNAILPKDVLNEYSGSVNYTCIR